MPQAVAISIGAGLLSALFTLSLLTGSVAAFIFAYLAPLPIFAVGFALGMPASLIATGSGALAIALMADFLPAITFIASTGAPCCLIVRQALLNRTSAEGSIEWYPPGHILMWMAGYIVVLLAVIGFVANAFLQDAYAQMVVAIERAAEAEAGTVFGPYFEAMTDADVRNSILRWVPGVMAASWIFLMVINAVLAQGALSGMGKARRPNPAMSDIELPISASVVLIGSLAVGSTVGSLLGAAALTVALAALAIFTLSGLGILHAILANRQARTPALVGIYIFLAIFFWPIFFVAGLAILEPWMGLKQRLAANPPNQGS